MKYSKYNKFTENSSPKEICVNISFNRVVFRRSKMISQALCLALLCVCMIPITTAIEETVPERHASIFSDYSLFEKAPPVPSPFTRVNISSHDGINIEALVFDTKVPRKSQPAIIFISSWGINKYEYLVPAKKFSDLGYTVVSYTARGFWGSSQRHGQPGGEISLAGPADVADVSAVIDWMLQNTHADPNRIGASGISYGGGLSLLAAAADPRIKSVVSMSCWVDLVDSLLGQGNTIRTEGIKELQLLAELTGTIGPDLQFLFDNYFEGTNLDQLKEIAMKSSPINVIDKINQNGASIFIANAYGDSLFTPNQFPAFFTALTGPKHLEFAPGDHAGAELSGLFPQRSNYTKIFGTHGDVWVRAEAWFDNYLMKGNTGAFAEMAPIIFNTITTNNTLDTFNSWSEVTSSMKKFTLGSRESLSPSKRSAEEELAAKLNTTVGTAATVTTGWSSIEGGIAIISNTIEAALDHSRVWDIKDIDRTYAAVFMTGRGDLGKSDLKVRGVPHLSLEIVPQADHGTVIAYLLDMPDKKVDIGSMITFAPYTFSGVKAGKAVTLEIDLTLTSWNIAEGHKLALVVGTKDRLFKDQNPAKSTISITENSVFELPLH